MIRENYIDTAAISQEITDNQSPAISQQIADIQIPAVSPWNDDFERMRDTCDTITDTNCIRFEASVLIEMEIIARPPNMEVDECSICLESFAVGTGDVAIGYIRECSHIFHFTCVQRWIQEYENCPFCRKHVHDTHNDVIQVSLSKLNSLFSKQHNENTDPTSVKSYGVTIHM